MIRRLRMPRRATVFIGALTLMVGGLVALNAGVANAHNWGSWHWDKSGSQIVIQSQIYGSTTTEAEAARQNAWNTIGILYNYRVDYHTDVSVFDGNFGDTGWGGLASIESSAWDWGCFGWCHITHGHARFNTFYGGGSAWTQGVYCQEAFHTYGFDHSDTGDCMGLGYFASGTSFMGPHNNTDFYNRYINH